MFRSNWRFIFTVVGCLIAAGVLSWLLYPDQPQLTGNATYQERDAKYRAGGSDCEPAIIDRLADRERQRRSDSCREVEENHRLQTNDLERFPTCLNRKGIPSGRDF